MPIVFSKAEVKQFLDEQGFDVDDEDTLRKFIHDLKKLIKFEEMKRRRRRLGHFPDETVLDSTDGRHAYTTTTSGGQDESSYDNEDGFAERSRRFQNQRSPQRPPVAVDKKSPVKASKSPVRRQQRGQQEKPRSGYYETDETSSYGDSGDGRPQGGPNKQKEVQRAPPPMKPGVAKKVPIPTTNKAPTSNAPPKKPGNRLIMKRFTAHQGVNGDSVIEESDIDLGPVRRQMGYKPGARPVGRDRPQTAPVPGKGKPETGSNAPKKPLQIKQRPAPDRVPSKEKNELAECDDEIDADELFHAINELIFPLCDKDSQDSLCDSDRTKTLLKPPPHVARDPVALYHWYKTYNWDVYTIPGEDRHMKLRWNVRAHTVGGYHPCIEYRKYRPKSSR